MYLSESTPLLMASPPEKAGAPEAAVGRKRRGKVVAAALAALSLALGAAVVLVAARHQRHRHSHLQTSRVSAASEPDHTLHALLNRLERGRERAPYCQAPVPSRATYKRPSAFHSSDEAVIERVLIISRHGDRAPQNVLRDDANPQGNVTWECSAASYMFLRDTEAGVGKHSSSTSKPQDAPAVVAKRVAKIPAGDGWRPHMWRGSCAPAELTAKGRAMMVDFGRHLREIYVDMLGLLPKQHDSTLFRVRATDVSRTLMSAHALVEGIYPHSRSTIDNDDTVAASHKSRSATVSIHVLPVDVDPIHSNKLDVSCPALQREQSKLRDDPVWKSFLQHSLPIRALVEALAPPRAPSSGSDALIFSALTTAGSQVVLPWSKVEAMGKKGVPSVTENLACRECWNMPQPCAPAAHVYARLVKYARAEGWSTAETNMALASLPQYGPASVAAAQEGQLCLNAATVRRAHLFKSFDFFYRNNHFANHANPIADPIVPLELGPLLREWHAALTAPHHQAHRAHLYLAHDGTLSGLLGALRAAPEHHAWPAYRSNVVVEVWRIKRTGERRVRVLHDGEPLVTEGKGALSLGDGSLSLDRFLGELLLRRSVDDWEAACQADLA